MYKTCIVSDEAGEMGEEGNDVMLNFTLNLIDFSHAEFSRAAALPDVFCGLFGDNAKLLD